MVSQPYRTFSQRHRTFSQAYRTQNQPELQDTAKHTGQVSQTYRTNQPSLLDIASAKPTGHSKTYRTKQPTLQDKTANSTGQISCFLPCLANYFVYTDTDKIVKSVNSCRKQLICPVLLAVLSSKVGCFVLSVWLCPVGLAGLSCRLG